MNKRGLGAVLISLSVLLYISNKSILYLSASILGANGEMHTNKMKQLLGYIQTPLPKNLIILTLVVGILFIIWEELIDLNRTGISRFFKRKP